MPGALPASRDHAGDHVRWSLQSRAELANIGRANPPPEVCPVFSRAIQDSTSSCITLAEKTRIRTWPGVWRRAVRVKPLLRIAHHHRRRHQLGRAGVEPRCDVLSSFKRGSAFSHGRSMAVRRAPWPTMASFLPPGDALGFASCGLSLYRKGIPKPDHHGVRAAVAIPAVWAYKFSHQGRKSRCRNDLHFQIDRHPHQSVGAEFAARSSQGIPAQKR